MMNLNAKLTGIDDDKLVTRLIEVWNFFWVQVLPYVEGVSGGFHFYKDLVSHPLHPGLPSSTNRLFAPFH